MTTEVIVTQSGNINVIQEQIINRVVTDDKPARIITSGMLPPPVVNSITAAADIDINNLQNGSTLIYNSSTRQWTATKLLDQQIIESGQF